MKIKLDISKDINSNANFYFEKAKKLKAKIPGIDNILERTQKEIENFEKEKDNYLKRKETKAKIENLRPKKWYDKFRWTNLSDGTLFVIGKDAGTNEVLIKKHVEENDIIFHTSAPGSPFGILKNFKDRIKEKELLEEASQFVCCFSSQWKKGFGTADCFWVFPDQVSKKAESGEFMSKGSFMIRGQKNEIRNIPLQIVLGVREEIIKDGEEEHKILEGFSGSLKACQTFCKSRFIKFEPGQDNYKKVNKQIKTKLKFSFDDLPKLIPNNLRLLKK